MITIISEGLSDLYLFPENNLLWVAQKIKWADMYIFNYNIIQIRYFQKKALK